MRNGDIFLWREKKMILPQNEVAYLQRENLGQKSKCKTLVESL